MKKLLFSCAILALIGCDKGGWTIDYIYPTDYVYANESSSPITVHSFIVNDGSGGSVDSLFVIPVNETHRIRLWNDPPLGWTGYPDNKDYTIISNGITTITQTRGNNDLLYRDDSYIFVYQSEDFHRIFLYAFTDDFFETEVLIE